MEDVLLLQFLRKKGIISDRDMHEFHELASTHMNEEPVYLSNSMQSTSHIDSNHMNETEARELVSKMYHIEGGRKYIGEKFDMYKAEEIRERYKGVLPVSVTICDVYTAINSQYHDYAVLFKSWFGSDIEPKIIESAIMYWFRDEDFKDKNKVYKYFMKA